MRVFGFNISWRHTNPKEPKKTESGSYSLFSRKIPKEGSKAKPIKGATSSTPKNLTTDKTIKSLKSYSSLWMRKGSIINQKSVFGDSLKVLYKDNKGAEVDLTETLAKENRGSIVNVKTDDGTLALYKALDGSVANLTQELKEKEPESISNVNTPDGKVAFYQTLGGSAINVTKKIIQEKPGSIINLKTDGARLVLYKSFDGSVFDVTKRVRGEEPGSIINLKTDDGNVVLYQSLDGSVFDVTKRVRGEEPGSIVHLTTVDGKLILYKASAGDLSNITKQAEECEMKSFFDLRDGEDSFTIYKTAQGDLVDSGIFEDFFGETKKNLIEAIDTIQEGNSIDVSARDEMLKVKKENGKILIESSVYSGWEYGGEDVENSSLKKKTLKEAILPTEEGVRALFADLNEGVLELAPSRLEHLKNQAVDLELGEARLAKLGKDIYILLKDKDPKNPVFYRKIDQEVYDALTKLKNEGVLDFEYEGELQSFDSVKIFLGEEIENVSFSVVDGKLHFEYCQD